MEFDTSTAITSSVSTGMAVALRSARRSVGAATPPASAATMIMPAARNEISEVCARMPALPLDLQHGATRVWPRIGPETVVCADFSAASRSRIVTDLGHRREAPMPVRIRKVVCGLGGLMAMAAVQCAFTGEAGAQADAVAAFYRGRTVQAVVGYTPGSTFEFYLRTLTRHLGRHIPGHPTIVVQHMPGAGSLNATAYLAAAAPKDGSVIGMINPVNTTEPLIDPGKTRFDPRTFQWLGSLNSEISTCAFWNKELRTLADLKRREITVGSTGPSSGSTVDAKVLGPLAGINFKVVPGYPGLTEVRLAAERGEVDGHCGLLVSAIKTDVWDAYKAGRLAVPVQMGLQKHPELPDVPNAYDLATRDDEDRKSV